MKNINKLESLDASQTKIEVSTNDKMKMATKKTTLNLVKKLTSTFINCDDKGFVLNPQDLQVKIFQLNKKNSRQENNDIIWKQIEASSIHNKEWSELFS